MVWVGEAKVRSVRASKRKSGAFIAGFDLWADRGYVIYDALSRSGLTVSRRFDQRISKAGDAAFLIFRRGAKPNRVAARGI